MSNDFKETIKLIELFVDGTHLTNEDYKTLLENFIIEKQKDGYILSHIGKFILKNKGQFIELTHMY